MLDNLRLVHCCHRLVGSTNALGWSSQNKDGSEDSEDDFEEHHRIEVVGVALECLYLTWISENIVEAIGSWKAPETGVLIHHSIWDKRR